VNTDVEITTAITTAAAVTNNTTATTANILLTVMYEVQWRQCHYMPPSWRYTLCERSAEIRKQFAEIIRRPCVRISTM